MAAQRLIVVGTDTGVGKTVFAAALSDALDAYYWKPVQSGLDEETDSQCVARLAPAVADKILPEAYRLHAPLSPHLSAERDGVTIDPQRLDPRALPAPLVVEAAGGLLAPLTRQLLTIDLIARWSLPVVLCSRTALGAINHALLSVEALRARRIALLGIAFIGDDRPDTMKTIADFSGAKGLGRLPMLNPLTPDNLASAFAENFRPEDFSS